VPLIEKKKGAGKGGVSENRCHLGTGFGLALALSDGLVSLVAGVAFGDLDPLPP
jgi:hypothetical protein